MRVAWLTALFVPLVLGCSGSREQKGAGEPPAISAVPIAKRPVPRRTPKCIQEWPLSGGATACVTADAITVEAAGGAPAHAIRRDRVLDADGERLVVAGGCASPGGAASEREVCVLAGGAAPAAVALPAGIGDAPAGVVRLADGRFVATGERRIAVWSPGGRSEDGLLQEQLERDGAIDKPKKGDAIPPGYSGCYRWTPAAPLRRTAAGELEVIFEFTCGDPAARTYHARATVAIDAGSDLTRWTGPPGRGVGAGWQAESPALLDVYLCEASDWDACDRAATLESASPEAKRRLEPALVAACGAGHAPACR